jgi:hypothetical protein
VSGDKSEKEGACTHGDSEFVSTSPSPMSPDAMTEAKFIRGWRRTWCVGGQ